MLEQRPTQTVQLTNRGIPVSSICLISISNSVSDGATSKSVLNIERPWIWAWCTESRSRKALAKRSQHINATYPNIVGPTFASSGQTIATIEQNRSQHCWEQHVACVWPPCCNMLQVKNSTNVRACTSTTLLHWPNDYNIMQHPQMLHEKFDLFQIGANNTQHVAACCNTSQQGDHTRATCCTQQCCNMLRWMLRLFGRGLIWV